MPRNPQVEYDAFIRWLSTSPHKIDEYAADPEGFLEAAQVGEIVRARVQAIGLEGLRRAVQADAQTVLNTVNAPNFGRDETVRGFGARPPSSS